MAVELEAKMRVPDHAAVRARLEGAGARPAGEVLETNTFFDTRDHALLARDEGLRLRQTLRAGSGERRCVVTFKGPQQAGALKRREEVEFDTTNADATSAIFALLGFVPELTFEKRRETWLLDGCTVELDELPHLGSFVEIEGPDEGVVLSVRERLGLGGAELVKTSYASMVAQMVKDAGSSARIVAFEPRAC